MSDTEIKVTDKRMFTPDGRLREEYQFLEERLEGKGAAPAGAGGEPEPPAAADESPSGPAPGGESRSTGEEGAAGGEAPRPAAGPALELPDLGPDMGQSPQFFDLVAMLAEPASVYMGDVEMPGAGPVEDLQMARLHIDLLGVLRQRTAGNLSAQESTFLDNVLYQLRSRYIQKRG